MRERDTPFPASVRLSDAGISKIPLGDDRWSLPLTKKKNATKRYVHADRLLIRIKVKNFCEVSQIVPSDCSLSRAGLYLDVW